MTPKTRSALVQKIKIAQKQLQIDDDSYRAILKHYGGAVLADGETPSSTKLDASGLENVLARMRELGFVDTRPNHAGPKPQGAASKQALLDKIDAYLAEAGKPTAYAVGMAKRMYKVERLEWLGIGQLRGIVAALEKAAQKAGRATA